MGRLGLPATRETAEAVDACRYELWPAFLRAGCPPWILVDVGAHEGTFVRAVATLVPLKQVHAFEPLPSCHAVLEHVLSRVPNARLVASAVGSRSGDVEIHVARDSKMSSVLPPKGSGLAGYRNGELDVCQRIRAPLVTLDETLRAVEPIHLLKIDVQGYELEVLGGAVETLKRTRAVLLEVNYVDHYSGGAAFDEVLERMNQAGFRVCGISAPYANANSRPMWADAMFVKQDSKRQLGSADA